MKNAPVLLAAMALLWSGFAYSQPGSPDPSFGGGDGFSTLSFLSNGHSSVNAMAVQANGRILVAGDTWLPNGTENGEMAIARFMPNGSADPTFSGDGKTTLSLANMAVGISDMLILSDLETVGGLLFAIGTLQCRWNPG